MHKFVFLVTHKSPRTSLKMCKLLPEEENNIIKHRISQLDGMDDSCIKEDVSVQADDSLSLFIIGEVAEDCPEYMSEKPFGIFPTASTLTIGILNQSGRLPKTA